MNRKEGVVDRRRGGKTIIKNRHGCALPADLGKLKQDTKGVVAKPSESESELFTGDTPKDNHSPGPVFREVSP